MKEQKYKPKNHAKMYAPDNILDALKEAAKEQGMSQTQFMLLAVKARIIKANK